MPDFCYVVAIDSFDTPNAPNIQPKFGMPHLFRGQFANAGLMLPKHRDIRDPHTVNPQGAKYNHDVASETHFLILAPTKTINNPLVNYQYNDRRDCADARIARNPIIMAIWWKKIKITRDSVKLEASIPHDNPATRLKIDILDYYRYKGAKAKKRYVHGLPTLAKNDIKSPVPLPHDAIKTWHAMGCTCMDMMARGVVGGGAEFGCKHVIQYNKCVGTNDVHWNTPAP
jgi:hypothetical protein